MKKNIITSVFIISTVPLLLIRCTKSPDDLLPKEPVEIEITSEQVALIESENSFAFDIFSKIIENEGIEKNIIISPLSISYALSMALNGANGETRDEMLEALKVNGITPEEINDSYSKLTDALLSVDERVMITVANSVWSKEGFPVKQSFVDILEKYYDAESHEFDVYDPQTPDIINKWIEDNTNGLIKEMLDKLDPDVVMLLINAIYFKGMWKYQFDKSDTYDRPFYKNGDVSVKVPMMSQGANFKLYKGEDFMLAELPYGQGNFVMDIILPDDQNGINAILPSITENAFNDCISRTVTIETDLFLPRFKYTYKKSLVEILKDMGMEKAFSEFADFSNITDISIYISEVLHQAFIETNEEGTEAAAATVVVFNEALSGPGNLVFNADHPFIYIIREISTNSIIFMGLMADPLAG